MNDKIDIIVAGVNWKDKKMWGDFYDRFYTALCVYVSKILPVPDAVEDLGLTRNFLGVTICSFL